MKDFTSLWIDDVSGKKFATLDTSLQVDVVIIGGGLAGLSTAYFLCNKGLKIAIVEAERVGIKTSGHTTAKVTVFHDLKYTYLKNAFSQDDAKMYAQSQQWAIDEMEKVIQAHDIDCQWQRQSVYAFAQTVSGRKKIKKEYDTAVEIGLPVSFFDKDKSLPFSITGEIMFTNQAQFHPRKFLISLAEIVSHKGVSIYENARVTKIDESNGYCRVKVGKYHITAKKSIIATNYPVYDKGFFFARMKQIRSYAVAARLHDAGPEGAYVGIDGDGITYRPYVQQGEWWAIIGGEDNPTGKVTTHEESPFDVLEIKARRLFDVKNVGYRWAAQDSTSIDRVPYIGKMPRTKNIFVVTGFGEWGMTNSFVAARVLSDVIFDKANAWENLYSPARIKPLASLSGMEEITAHIATGFGSYITKSKKIDVEKMAPHDGTVAQCKGKMVAVHKDLKGKIQAVSAVCTHMGCIVNWNKHEKSWDCPCHGSRFDVTGKILDSPATKPLAKKKVS